MSSIYRDYLDHSENVETIQTMLRMSRLGLEYMDNEKNVDYVWR